MRGSFRPRLFGDLSQPDNLAFRDTCGGRTGGRSNHEDLLYTPDPNDPWVDVDVAVSRVQLAASFRPGSTPVPAQLPMLMPVDERVFKRCLPQRYPDLAGVPFEGSAVGLFVRHAGCTIQAFRVGPLDTYQ